jgi:hypothetical protein
MMDGMMPGMMLAIGLRITAQPDGIATASCWGGSQSGSFLSVAALIKYLRSGRKEDLQ